MSLLDGLVGAILVAIILSSILFGILTVQVQSYYCHFPNDPGWLKVMVGVLWAVDCAHQICACMISYDYMIRHYRDPSYLLRNISPLSATIVLEPILAFIVQCYYARRLYQLNPKWRPVTVLTIALAIFAFCFGLACGVGAYTVPFLEGFKRYTWVAWVWLLTCCVCDLVISGAIAYQLWTSRSGFKQTDKLLVKLTVWTINTGVAPAVLALVDIVAFVSLQNSLVHLSINIVLAKLYGNSALAFLNRRTPGERRNIYVSGPGDVHLSTTTKSFNGVPMPDPRNSPDNPVRFEVSRHQYIDPEPEEFHKQGPIELSSWAELQRTEH